MLSALRTCLLILFLKGGKALREPFDHDYFFVLIYIESLDDLTNLVVKLFSEVENKNVPLPEFPEHPFQEEHLRVGFETLYNITFA